MVNRKPAAPDGRSQSNPLAYIHVAAGCKNRTLRWRNRFFRAERAVVCAYGIGVRASAIQLNGAQWSYEFEHHEVGLSSARSCAGVQHGFLVVDDSTGADVFADLRGAGDATPSAMACSMASDVSWRSSSSALAKASSCNFSSSV
jgi:hypothetical protein